MENYLLEINDYHLRKILSKFRFSRHCLKIEKRCHVKPKVPLEHGICNNCNMGCVESEQHILLECKLYQEERIRLFTNLILYNAMIIN